MNSVAFGPCNFLHDFLWGCRVKSCEICVALIKSDGRPLPSLQFFLYFAAHDRSLITDGGILLAAGYEDTLDLSLL